MGDEFQSTLALSWLEWKIERKTDLFFWLCLKYAPNHKKFLWIQLACKVGGDHYKFRSSWTQPGTKRKLEGKISPETTNHEDAAAEPRILLENMHYFYAQRVAPDRPQISSDWKVYVCDTIFKEEYLKQVPLHEDDNRIVGIRLYAYIFPGNIQRHKIVIKIKARAEDESTKYAIYP